MRCSSRVAVDHPGGGMLPPAGDVQATASVCLRVRTHQMHAQCAAARALAGSARGRRAGAGSFPALTARPAQAAELKSDARASNVGDRQRTDAEAAAAEAGNLQQLERARLRRMQQRGSDDEDSESDGQQGAKGGFAARRAKRARGGDDAEAERLAKRKRAAGPGTVRWAAACALLCGLHQLISRRTAAPRLCISCVECSSAPWRLLLRMLIGGGGMPAGGLVG